MVPCAPRWIAASGITVASLRVSTIIFTLTNWFGNSSPSGFGNCAFSLMVPVAVSIWLSVLMRKPVASLFFCSRSHASTANFSPAFNCFNTRCKLSCGIVNTTVIGSICVITTNPAASLERMMLPESTCRNPRRPGIGAVTLV